MDVKSNNQTLRQSVQFSEDATVRWEGSRRHVSLIKKLALAQDGNTVDRMETTYVHCRHGTVATGLAAATAEYFTV